MNMAAAATDIGLRLNTQNTLVQLQSFSRDCEGGDHQYGKLGLRVAVRLQAKVRKRGLGLRRGLNAGPLCGTQRR